MTGTPLFTIKTNPAEEGRCLCQRDQEKSLKCAGTEGVLLSELQSKDGPHMKEADSLDLNPWADADPQGFNSQANANRRSFEEGYVYIVRNHGVRQMDLEE